MSINQIAFYALWLTPALVRVAIVAIMLRGKLHQQFPFFFTYTAYHVLQSGILLYLLQQEPWVYFYSYWSAQAISFVLGFAVIYEIVGHVLRSYEALWALGRKLFFGTAGLLVLLAVSTAVDASTTSDYNALMAWIFVAERGLRMVQCGLLASLIVFSGYFAITWRHHIFGIALGLGMYASVELAATAVRSEVGWIGHETYSLVTRVAYACATLIWAAYLLRPEPARVAVNRLPRTQVEQWNQALEELWQR
jgi:hypothetical protein